MKAAVHARYGPPEVVRVLDVPTPQPAAGEVLVRVHATTVTRTDCGMRGPHPWFVRLGEGLLRPRHTILGMDFAGVVQALGPGVTGWQVGEPVFGLSPEVYGAHAEFLCVRAAGPMARLPAGVAFHEGVVGEGAWYADTYLRKLRLGPGRRLLIYGASGAIGTAAVLLAKATGASVTAVVATRHVDLARSLGLSLDSALVRSERVIFPLPQASRARAVLERLRGLMEAHAYRAVVDRRYPLAAIVDAYRYVETGQKTGIVVVDFAAG